MQIRRIIENVMLVALVAIAGGWYLYIHRTPCKDTIEYRIGSIDAGFRLSPAELRSAVDEAVALWEEGMGIDLFAYNPNGSLPVSMTYDTRQALTDYGNELKERLDAERAAAESINKQYAQKRAEYAAATKAGASYEERKRLADELNALAKRYNEAVDQANRTVAQYNRNTGREFEAGLYTRTGWGKEQIELYEYSTRTELVRLIAHELGHALGLEHNDNPTSIMYHQNSGGSLALSAEDKADLRKLCGIIE